MNDEQFDGGKFAIATIVIIGLAISLLWVIPYVLNSGITQ